MKRSTIGWIAYGVVIVAIISLVCVLMIRSNTTTYAAEEKPTKYLFASFTERMQKMFPLEEAEIQICMMEKITGLDCDQNPLVSVLINREGKYDVYYISKICVPGEGDSKPYLWIEKSVAKISGSEKRKIRKECEGGR